MRASVWVGGFGLGVGEGDVFELGVLAFVDEGDDAFGVFEAGMGSFDDVVVDGGAVVVAGDFDGEGVPGVGVDGGFEFGDFGGLGGFGDAGHVGDPDGVRRDVGAGEVVVWGDGVAAAEGDLGGGAEAKLGSDDEVGGVEAVGAGGVMVVGFEFGAVEGAVFDGPFADAGLPAVDGAFAGGRGGLVEWGGDDEGGGFGDGGDWGFGGERVEGEAESDEGKEEVH